MHLQHYEQQLKDFYREVKQYKLEDIICIDETSINAIQKRKHCYSEVGKRCVITTNNNERTNVLENYSLNLKKIISSL